PYLLVGWLWYLGTLVPVIGLVQVGGQGRADRYTYVPLVGLTIAVVYLVAEVIARYPRARAAARGVVVVLLAGLVVGTWVQITYWKDTVTLWRHTLAVTAGNYEAHRNLAAEWERRGNFTEAVKEYEAALESFPDKRVVHNDLGALWMKQGDLGRA